MPQYNNPYYVEPANLSLGFDKAMAGVQKGIETRKATKQTAEDKQAMSTFADNFENMTPVEVGQYVLKNPRVAKFIVGAVDTTDKMTKQEKLADAVEVARAYITGDQGGQTQPQPGQPLTQPPVQPQPVQPTIGLDNAPVAPVGQSPIPQPEAGPVGKDKAIKILSEHVQENLNRGGDSKEGIELVRDALTGGEKAFKGAMATIAALDPQTFDRLMELQGGGEEEAGSGTDIGKFVDDSMLMDAAKQPNATADEIEEGRKAKVRQTALLKAKRPQAAETKETVTAKETARMEVAMKMSPGLERDKALARIQAEGEESRAQAIINDSYELAEGMPTLNRAISLLQTVETGGWESMSLAVRAKLGIEGADEGELNNSLGIAVLSQLKDTFGAAFTFGEGESLKDLEASFGKSNATNLRLLKRALRKGTQKIKTAIRRAKERKDTVTAKELQGFLDFSLDPDSGGSSLPAGVTEDDIATTMQNNNMTREQVLARLAGR